MNSYLLHFGNIKKHHFWENIQNWFLNCWGRHTWLIVLTKLYPETTSVSPAIYHIVKITRGHQREISREESHYFRKLGNWITVIEKKHDVFGASFLKKMILNFKLMTVCFESWCFFRDESRGLNHSRISQIILEFHKILVYQIFWIRIQYFLKFEKIDL